MPKYKSFPQNSEVIDVFCCVLLNHNTVKTIQNKLKQPQSTISEKLKFLVKNGVIEKDKWVFKLNWSKITEVSRVEIKKFFESFTINFLPKQVSEKEIDGYKRDIKMFLKYFDQNKIKAILETYADYFINEGWLEKKSISDIFLTYFDGLAQCEDKEIEKRPELLKMKQILSIVSMEKFMFLDVEGLS